MPPVPELLKSNLPHSANCSGSQWQMDADDQPFQGWTESIEAPETIPSECLLKRAPRRLVFKQGPHVIKAFPFSGVRRWKGQAHYARAECENLLEAAKRSLPVPTCHAYGERSIFGGGLRWSACVMERLRGQTIRDQWLENPDAIDVESTLPEITLLAYQLYESGCNHIDFGPHAVVLAPTGPKLIDWQYATFLPEPNPAVFASQIGYFAWATSTNRSWATPTQMEKWFEALWERYQIPHKASCLPIFNQARTRRSSINERLAAQETFRL